MVCKASNRSFGKEQFEDMRTRNDDTTVVALPSGTMTTTAPPPGEAGFGFPPGTYPLHYPTPATYVTGVSETISDELTADYRRYKARKILPYHFVDHTKTQYGPPAPFLTKMEWRGSTCEMVGSWVMPKSIIDSHLSASAPSFDPDTVSSAVAEAVRRTQQQDGTSLFNFIVELAELAGLVKGLVRPMLDMKAAYLEGLQLGKRSAGLTVLATLLRNPKLLRLHLGDKALRSFNALGDLPWETLSQIAKGVRKPSGPLRSLVESATSLVRSTGTGLSSLIVTAADMRLMYAYGVRPFVQDLQGFERAYKRVDQLVAQLSRGKRLIQRARMKVPLSTSTVRGQWTGNTELDLKSTITTSTELTVCAVATSLYSDDCLDGLSRLKMQLDSLGFFPTANRLYQAVPLVPILLDYFTGLGNYLDSVDGREYIIKPKVETIGRSVKLKQSMTSSIVVHAMSSSQTPGRTIIRSTPAVCISSRSWYTRGIVDLEDIVSPIAFRAPSFNQMVNLGSLIVVNSGGSGFKYVYD